MQTVLGNIQVGVIGGSGLYIKSITHGLIPPAVPPQNNLRKQFKSLGQEFCYQLLKIGDANAAQKINKSENFFKNDARNSNRYDWNILI